MAFPTTVNGQTTDTVTQVNTGVLGLSPGVAMGSLYLATSQALANAASNATYNQQQNNLIAQAVTTRGLAILTGAAAP